MAYMPLIIKGFGLTVALSILSLLLGTLFGCVGALTHLFGSSVARKFVYYYVVLVRGVPDLLLMLLLFFGGQKIINDIGKLTGLWVYIDLDQFSVGVAVISFIAGAYMTETFRGAFLAIEKGKIEAALACGMSKFTIFKRIMLKPLVFYALPSYSNNTLVFVKTTALVSVIGLQDVVYNSFLAGKATSQTFTFLFVSFCAYLLLTAVLELLFVLTQKYYCNWAETSVKT